MSEAQPHPLSLSLDFNPHSRTVTTGHSPIPAGPWAAWTGLGQQAVSLKQSHESFPQGTRLLQGNQTVILEALRLQSSIIRISGRSACDEISLEESRAPGRLRTLGDRAGAGIPQPTVQPVGSPLLSTCVCVLSLFSQVRLFATPWTVAYQAPLSMEILQARILEWVAMPSFRASSLLWDRPHLCLLWFLHCRQIFNH